MSWEATEPLMEAVHFPRHPCNYECAVEPGLPGVPGHSGPACSADGPSIHGLLRGGISVSSCVPSQVSQSGLQEDKHCLCPLRLPLGSLSGLWESGSSLFTLGAVLLEGSKAGCLLVS